MMAKVPAFAKAFGGRWRIAEVDVWDSDVLDLVEPAHLTFEGPAYGEIAFGALKGFLDVHYGPRDGADCAAFSWQGYDDNDPACGRGWVIICTVGRLVGHFFIHNADHSGFVCEPDRLLQQPARGRLPVSECYQGKTSASSSCSSSARTLEIFSGSLMVDGTGRAFRFAIAAALARTPRWVSERVLCVTCPQADLPIRSLH
jgi:hypothetical protein